MFRIKEGGAGKEAETDCWTSAMVLCQRTVDRSLRVGVEVLPQAREYLGVLFRRDGKMGREMDRRFSAPSAVMGALWWTVVVKRVAEVEGKALNLPVPHLYSWVLSSYWKNEIVDKSSSNEFPLLAGLSGWGEDLGIEPLLHVKKSLLIWFWHLIRMPSGHPTLEVFKAHPTWGDSGVESEIVGGIIQYIPFGLGTPWDTPGGAGMCCWGRRTCGRFGILPKLLIGCTKYGCRNDRFNYCHSFVSPRWQFLS